jgi:hypothetical protein
LEEAPTNCIRRFRYRLNRGFGSVFRLNAFGFTAPSTFLSISLSLPDAMLASLPNEWQL